MRLNKLLATATFASATLLSATLMQTTSASAVTCGGSLDTVGEWSALGSTGCTIGDKKFVYSSSDLGESYVIDFLQNGGLSYSFIGDGNLNGPTTKFIAYTVEVTDPNFRITGVRLDSTISVASGAAPASTVTKTIRDTSSGGAILDTLVSTDGSIDDSIALFNTKLFIRDDISVASADTLSSFTNTFTQTSTVPEPATLTILGMGLLGLGALRRRKA